MRKLIFLLGSAAGALAFAPGLAVAHAGAAPPSHGAVAAAPLLLLALAYAGGVARLRRRGAFARACGPWRVASFVLGLLSLALVTASPVADWSERLFSTHMAQHLALMLIAAPLLVAARTTPIALAAVAGAARVAWLRALGRIGRRLLAPLVIWLAFNGLFLLWHLPGLYAAALRHDGIHALEHVSFFLSAYAFWSLVMAPAGRGALGYGARLFFVVSAALLSGLPGALIALSSRPLYASDPQAAACLGLTALDDQQLAGLVMWIPGGLAYIAAALALLLRWMREAERRAPRRLPGAGLALVGGACLALTLSSCDDATRGAFGEAAAPLAQTGGDPRKGAADIAAIGCGACHTIPGVNGAAGLVGPPLNRLGRRVYIAGLLRNTPENLEAWLRDPQKIVPGNVMPNMGLTEEQTRDIAAYLYTLK